MRHGRNPNESRTNQTTKQEKYLTITNACKPKAQETWRPLALAVGQQQLAYLQERLKGHIHMYDRHGWPDPQPIRGFHVHLQVTASCSLHIGADCRTKNSHHPESSQLCSTGYKETVSLRPVWN